MAIRVSLHHRTEYRFDRTVALAPHVIRLRPAPHSRTPILGYALDISPREHFINWQQDPFGNYLARLVFQEKARQLSVSVNVVAEMTVINPFDFFPEDYAEKIPFRYPPQLARELAPYLEVREDGPRLRKWLAEVDRSPVRSVDFLVDLNRRLQRDISYVVRMEPGIQSCETTLQLARGSCRDSAWLLAQILRHLGLAARFVSGYLIQLTADVESLDGPSGPTADFTDLHAWTEVYLPGAGWLGLDPTSGLFAGEGHIPLACTPDPVSAAPITGATDKCEVEFSFVNEVRRIHEDPRVTKPYSDAQWQSVMALGGQVDRELEKDDVRLTMGGEPTFVSIDDMDGAEWSTAALGEDKRRLAGDLLARLRKRFTRDAATFVGQGKWYPGEPLPRWALGVYWRTDGEPLWRDPALVADDAADGKHGAGEAERFARELAKRLGLGADAAVTAYEDVYYYLWKEGTLPDNVDPLECDLKDSLERRRVARLLERGLGEVAGYALPLKWTETTAGEGGWRTSKWTFRRGRMYLLPGDSPMGYRLPLESLAQVPPEAREPQLERDPFEERGPLPGEGPLLAAVRDDEPRELARMEPADAHADDGDWPVHTALCVEPRDGHLCVFLPPMTHLEHFVALLAAVEETAAAAGTPVRLEGYEPPSDPRLLALRITPDPGVIEVNVHPAHSWDQLVANTEILYEEARLSRLGTEKFMLDGRHSGTGGGNHVTIGGAAAADSPALRRPALLQSLVTYWQHHPGLSYLFSGTFIGPTSQAPRVDEARDETLYELEIAFQQIPGGESSPWVVDRVLRNLLVDVTGNTHRSEFCIDKLYSPDSPSGRLGLVEFRAFEMPPHPRMSAVQMLLLRALVARFWSHPYRRAPVRWGTELHDRFMLPHYVDADLQDVVCDLQRWGYPFDREWLAPFLEFRFPHYGRVVVNDIELELHWAIEPWHVLGEEVSAQGTSRFVDSSVERLQVRTRGMNAARFAVTCNGRRVPLRPTSARGEHVAGVRYKAWQPPSGLHPTIPPQAPLVFDVVDTWNECSLGGCTYHVVHPGGLSYETFPVNANEAEARRIARFWPYGHTAGPMTPPPEEPSGDYPYTLDLRYRRTC